MRQNNLLNKIHEHAVWTDDPSWSCREGCASCCTRSVTITTLEGKRIVDYLLPDKKGNHLLSLLNACSGHPRPTKTTNGFAADCLAKCLPDDTEKEQGWDFRPCIFLDRSRCTIYPVRPFACRCFLSKVSCATKGYAEVEPVIITLNTVFQQIIEHLDRDGYWGNMIDILLFLMTDQQPPADGYHPAGLLSCRKLPGFLIPPEEKEEVMHVLNRLYCSTVGESNFLQEMNQLDEIKKKHQSIQPKEKI